MSHRRHLPPPAIEPGDLSEAHDRMRASVRSWPDDIDAAMRDELRGPLLRCRAREIARARRAAELRRLPKLAFDPRAAAAGLE